MNINEFLLERKGLNMRRATLFKKLVEDASQQPTSLLQWKVLWAFTQGVFDTVRQARRVQNRRKIE